jgi:hypothetical protein
MKLRAACLALILGVLTACGGGGGGGDAPPPAPPPATGTVTGVVTATLTGAPVAGAVVRAGTLSATAGSDGRFTLANVPPNARTVLRFEAAGYAPLFETAEVVASRSASVSASLTPVGVSQTVSSAAANVVVVPNSTARVSLPANGFVNAATNAPVSGNITVAVTPINPAADAASMPGDYTNAAGQPIESFGAIQVDLRDGAGNRLDLAPNQSASIRIPLSARGPAPATIPLFFFDETTGRWVQEGSATLAGTAPNQYYEGTVTHFTFWNADIVLDTITVSGCVQNAQGARVSGAAVESRGIDYVGSAFAATDANGNFTVPMRRNSRALIDAQQDALAATAVVVGPSATDITLTPCLVLNPAVAAPPVIVQQPQNRSVAAGESALFTVTADGPGFLTYQWRRNGQDIAFAVLPFLSLPNVQAADNGAVYSVVVRNASGSVTSANATLTVSTPTAAPAITTQPASQAALVGQRATFTVAASGSPAPTYQWRRQGQDIAGATAAAYTTPPTTLADNGAQFTVVVSNSAGSVTSAAATLTVTTSTQAPVITTQPANVTVAEGNAAVFSVAATGVPAPAYQWQRDGVNIAGATSASYTLQSPTIAADNGRQFRVIVSNSAGSVTSSAATLTVTPDLVSQQQNIVRLAFLSFDLFELATTSVYITDDNGVFLPAAQICAGGGSVVATLNGGAAPVGQAAPASGTLGATFTDCVVEPERTHNGSNSLQYTFTTPDRLNGTATGTMTNMRVRETSGATVDRDITGNGSVSGTLSGSIVGGNENSTINFTIAPGATLRSGLSNLTATFSAGTQQIQQTVNPAGIPLTSVVTLNDSTYAVAGTTYVASGSLTTQINPQGLQVTGSGQIVVSANGAQVGRIFYSNNVLSVEVNGQVVPFSRGGRVVATTPPRSPRALR